MKDAIGSYAPHANAHLRGPRASRAVDRIDDSSRIALLVEDDPATCLSMSALISRDGFEVDVAGTLAAAREALRRRAPQIVFCDLDLPDGNGLGLLSEIDTAKITVVVITGTTAVSTVVRAVRQGALDYLTKPVDVARLGEILHDVGGALRSADGARSLEGTMEPFGDEDEEEEWSVAACGSRDELESDDFMTGTPPRSEEKSDLPVRTANESNAVNEAGPAPAASAPAAEEDEVRIRVGSSIADGEKALILATLKRHHGNKNDAARTLGISVKTLYTRLSVYNAAR